MRIVSIHAVRTVALVLAAVLGPGTQQQTFRTTVDVVAVDVTVVDRAGKPIGDLEPEDFEVWISNRQRPVVSIDRRSYGRVPPQLRAAPPSGTGQLQTNEPVRRMFILAVDEHSLQPGSAIAAISAADRFIDKLQPDDLVSVYAYPTGVATHDLTTDHAAAKRALRSVMGLRMEPVSRFNLSPSEIIDCASGDTEVLRRVSYRECRGGACGTSDIRHEAISLAGFLEMTATQSVGALRSLIRGLGEIPGRKILLLVSGGLISTDRGAGRVNLMTEIGGLGREAAAANLDVFALHLDWSFQEALASKGGLRSSYFRDSNLAATGLEIIAGASAGSVIRVRGTSPEVAFDRVLRETSVYYVLGVAAGEEERDGRSHPIRVRVKRRGAEVRSRSEVIIPRR
jgi:VWFA-related protein